MIALRLGAFQLLHMDRIPARAAIDESVELAKQAGHRFASGMVNAVLRKLAKSPVQEAQEMAAHPAWMVERWISFYGLEATRAICRHGQSQPALTLRLAAPEVENELIAAGISLEAGELLTAARSVVSGDVSATPAFGAGRVRFQDEGSQLVAELAASNSRRDKKRILDACAAPGGKTLILAERHHQAHIVALEVSAPRLAQLQTRLAPLGERVECRLADATLLQDDGAYDLVLMCRAAARERWDAIRRSATVCGRRSFRVKPDGSARFFQPPCARCVQAGALFIPLARWSRKRTSRWLQRCWRQRRMLACFR
jgi:16S rRNA (cytosine967-C5)-methyltransferase